MRSIVTALQDVQKWLTDVAAGMELQLPSEDDRIRSYTLTNPCVHIGMIPPGSILPDSTVIRVPALLVGVSQGSFDDDESELQMTITAIVYDPGHQTDDGGELWTEMNFDGYITLLTVLDHISMALMRNQVIDNFWQISSPVSVQTYETQPWPYWYGQMKFNMTGAAYPQTRYKKE